MLEFLYMTLILFIPFFILFLICPSFKYTKIIMIFIQLVFSFAVASNILYKKHSLYCAPRVQYIQSTDFFPIKSLYKNENEEDGEYISFDRMDDNKFSIIKNEKYSTQCLENYFIKKDEACPITDIIFDNKSSNIYNDYIQKGNNEYFYYTNQNKLGKLYKSFNYSEFEENVEYYFSNDEINKIVKKELNKISNPILDFKYFIKFFDVICPIIIISSLFFSFFEDINDKKCGIIRVFNLIFQFIILIIYIIRFFEFIKVKQFLLENEDIYKNDSYFPNKTINFDSVPLAISTNILIINILNIISPNHKSCLVNPKNYCDFDEDITTAIFIIFLFLLKIIFEIFDFVNDSKIFEIYNNIIYNWKMNPIKNIQLYNNQTSEYLEYNLTWKGYIFELERLKDYNYINLYSHNNNKLCGKDNLGNNLYFPESIDCPINDIFISKNDENFPSYTKIKLDKNNYLYYSNKKTEGKLLIDFRVSIDSEIPLNPKGDSDSNYYSIPFYEEIDSNNDMYLYSINYLGINSSSVSNIKLEKLEKKINIFNEIFITKIIIFCVGDLCFIICIFLKYCYSDDKLLYTFIGLFITLYSANFILTIVCLSFQIQYVINFMNKINFDFENKKIDYKWNVMVLIYNLFFMLYFILLFNFKDKFEFMDFNYNKTLFMETKINIQKKDSNSRDNSDRDSISDKDSKNSEKNNHLIDENKKLSKKINSLINERDTLKFEIRDLKEENKILEKKIDTISNERDKLKKEKKDFRKKISDMTKEKNSLTKEKEILEKKIDVLEYEKNNYQKKYEDSIKKENNNKYKISSVQPGEEIISINFVSMGINAINNYGLSCKTTDLFIIEEERLYEDFPDFKKYETYFEANGKRIKRFQTLKENGIKDKNVIYVFTNENNI